VELIIDPQIFIIVIMLLLVEEVNLEMNSIRIINYGGFIGRDNYYIFVFLACATVPWIGDTGFYINCVI
jgi:hypothetical protein